MMARNPPKSARRRPDSPQSPQGAAQPQASPKEARRGNVGGRPPIEVTSDHLRQIEQLAGYGITEAAIAHIIGMDPRTFRRKKSDEEAVLSALEKGKCKAEGIIGQALFNRAKGGDLGSIIWWEKTRAGRVDSSQVRHADAKGDTLPAPQTIVYIPDNGRAPAIQPTGRVGANGHRPR